MLKLHLTGLLLFVILFAGLGIIFPYLISKESDIAVITGITCMITVYPISIYMTGKSFIKQLTSVFKCNKEN